MTTASTPSIPSTHTKAPRPPSHARLTSDCLLCQHLNHTRMTDVSTLGEFEHMVLLAVMRLGEDAYAVPVRDEIARCAGREVSRGSIYITLDRLETKGYLRSRPPAPTPP